MKQLIQLFLNLLKEGTLWVEVRLNYLDFITFALGVLIIFTTFFPLLKRKKRVLSNVAKKYEDEMQAIKKGHLKEICKAELRIRAFKEELENIETSYTQELEKQGQEYAKRILEVEKGRNEVCSTADLSVFELKQEMNRLRTKQLDQVKVFQGEVHKLKKEISSLHENHTKQIEQSEMEINGLRKQLRLLMYKVSQYRTFLRVPP